MSIIFAPAGKTKGLVLTVIVVVVVVVVVLDEKHLASVIQVHEILLL